MVVELGVLISRVVLEAPQHFFGVQPHQGIDLAQVRQGHGGVVMHIRQTFRRQSRSKRY